MHGIVLQAQAAQSGGSVVAEYERVGYFWTANQTMATGILENLGHQSYITIVLHGRNDAKRWLNPPPLRFTTILTGLESECWTRGIEGLKNSGTCWRRAI